MTSCQVQEAAFETATSDSLNAEVDVGDVAVPDVNVGSDQENSLDMQISSDVKAGVLSSELEALKAQQSELAAETAKLQIQSVATRQASLSKEQVQEVLALKKEIASLKAEIEKLRKSNSDKFSYSKQIDETLKDVNDAGKRFAAAKRSAEYAESKMRMDQFAAEIAASSSRLALENSKNRKSTISEANRRALEDQMKVLEQVYKSVKLENSRMQRRFEEMKRTKLDKHPSP